MQIIIAFGEKKLVFKINAPFINCVSEINSVKIDDVEDLDVVMPMYHLLEYSKNYKKTTGSLWNYYRDELNSNTDDNEKCTQFYIQNLLITKQILWKMV